MKIVEFVMNNLGLFQALLTIFGGFIVISFAKTKAIQKLIPEAYEKSEGLLIPNHEKLYKAVVFIQSKLIEKAPVGLKTLVDIIYNEKQIVKLIERYIYKINYDRDNEPKVETVEVKKKK